ncbi:glycine cleavage system H protein-like [Haliotis rufescens]|uniref:glycine cleavage system H protein-like n=1 Tax=Haliotis rufescens TaxID=6454 RepID=UPI001EB00328|nr:glycine cleavage system H protein-like [Haliotis rufescens]
MAACVLKRLTSLGSRGVLVAFRGVSPINIHVRCFSASAKLLADRYYTDRHEWVEVEKNIGTVGISNYAQELLGEVVYVQLPEIGQEFTKDDESGSLESVKAASEVFSPVTGKVTAVNHLVEDKPRLINDSPYDKGWLYKMELTDPDEFKAMMDEAAYKKFTESSN